MFRVEELLLSENHEVMDDDRHPREREVDRARCVEAGRDAHQEETNVHRIAGDGIDAGGLESASSIVRPWQAELVLFAETNE